MQFLIPGACDSAKAQGCVNLKQNLVVGSKYLILLNGWSLYVIGRVFLLAFLPIYWRNGSIFIMLAYQCEQYLLGMEKKEGRIEFNVKSFICFYRGYAVSDFWFAFIFFSIVLID